MLYPEPRVWSTYSSLCCMPLDVSVLQQSVLSLDVSVCLFYSSLCSWTYLLNSSLCCARMCVAYL